MAEELTEQQKEYLAKKAELKEAYLNTFSTSDGKKVLKDLEKLCFRHKPTLDVNLAVFGANEGLRMALLHIENMQNLDLDKMKKSITNQQGEENV